MKPVLFLLLFSINLFTAISLANDATADTCQAQFDTLFSKTMATMQASYIDTKAIPAIRQVLKQRAVEGAYDDVCNVQSFATRVGKDIRDISGDKHLSLYVVDKGEAISHILPDIPGRLGNNLGFEQVRYLYNNYVYIKLNKCHPSEEAIQVIDAAMAFSSHSEGLIFDLRETVGGSPELVSYLAGYLLPVNTPLWSVLDSDGNTVESVSVKHNPESKYYLNKPVWVLVGHNTASAAELFAGVLQATGRARLVGEQTAGAGYYVGVRNITDTLVFRISMLKPVIAATGQNWEKTGLTPDIAATSSDALDQVIQTILSTR